MNQLNIVENSSRAVQTQRQVIKKVINSYQNWLTRAYSDIRFRIIPLRFLEEISQYMPESGNILDLGCGFGLFSLYLALSHPRVQVTGIDISETRISMAKQSAQRLGIQNIQFHTRDVQKLDTLEKYNLIVTLDLLHHIPYPAGNCVINNISRWLTSDGVFLMKDITTQPKGMLLFTFLLDLLMNPKDSFYYRDIETWTGELHKVGFRYVERHYLWDILPYPHILLICRHR